MVTHDPSVTSIIDFWIGPLAESGLASREKSDLWFARSPSFDKAVRREFSGVYQDVVAGRHDDWQQTPRGALALVLVLDQFSRNMFRDTDQMYATDAQAARISKRAIAAGLDRQLVGSERVFIYMPLMHSEDLGDQEECVRLFEAFLQESEGPLARALARSLEFAKAHRDIIEAWGRFPHRNHLLGRPSTTAELEFLETPGSSF